MITRHAQFGVLAVAVIAMQACATRGYVREQIQESSMTTQTEVAAARDSAIRAANNTRMAEDSALERRIYTHVDSQIASLRADINALREDFDTRVTFTEDSITFAMPVHFEFDDATVRQSDERVLAFFAKVAKQYYPDSRITVEGFADPAGTQAYNMRLSRQRAEAVRAALVSHGLVESNLQVVGYGESRLVNPGAARNDEGAEKNRRVVFAIETVGSPLNVTALLNGDR